MGLGWIFAGYFFAFCLPIYSPLSISMPVGFILLGLGLYRLWAYQIRFRTAFFVNFISAPFALYFALYGVSEWGFLPALPLLGENIFRGMEWGYIAFHLAFHVVLLRALAALCRELGLASEVSAALRNLIFVGLYDAVYLLASFWTSHSALFAVPILLLRVVYLFLNLFLLFRCYRRIGPEGDEMMTKTGSRERGRSETNGQGREDGHD